MRKNIIKTLIFILAFMMSFVSHANESISVKSVEALLFYNPTGQWSEDILSQKDFSLWNVIIGEGSATALSDAFLLKIGFQGKKNEFVDKAVTLSVKEKSTGKLIISKTFSSFLLGAEGVIHKAILISGSNCTPLVIKVGNVRKELNFRCGE